MLSSVVQAIRRPGCRKHSSAPHVTGSSSSSAGGKAWATVAKPGVWRGAQNGRDRLSGTLVLLQWSLSRALVAPGRGATMTVIMALPMPADEVEAALHRFFSSTREARVVAAYLFGSIARGTGHSQSDVDVAVLYPADPPRTLAALPLDVQAGLERVLGAPVDVIVLNRAPVDLVHRVLRDGRLVFEGDRSARIRFEVRARNEFFDLLPILERYRRPRLARPADRAP